MARPSGRAGPDMKPGMMGISFAGGLSVVAASRLGSRVGMGAVVRRPRRSAADAALPVHRRPAERTHPAAARLRRRHHPARRRRRVVPPEQVEPLRQGILAFLDASHLAMVDKPRAALEFERARTLAATLPEPARTFMTWVNNRDVAHLGPALLPHVAALGGDTALSPARNPPPVGTGLSAARRRRQRHPGRGIRAAGGRSPRAAAAASIAARRRRSSPTPRSIVAPRGRRDLAADPASGRAGALG